MKPDEKIVDKLRYETKENYEVCEKALKKNKNNYEKAKEYIIKRSNSKTNRYFDNIMAFLGGSKAVRITIENKSGVILEIPIILTILILIIFPIPSFSIGLLLGVMVVFDTSVKVQGILGEEETYIKEKEIIKQTFEDENKENTDKKVYNNPFNKDIIIEEDNGYYILEIN